MLRLLRKAAFAFCVLYLVSLPVAFLVGGILLARPIRTPVSVEAVREGMEPGWSHSFLIDSREVKIQIESKIRLNATVFAGGSRSTVVVLHEAGKNRVQGLAMAYALWKEGLGVVLLDRRAHGNSDGEALALFGGEAEDLSAVIDEMTRSDWCGSKRIGLFGIGDAGTSCLIAAAQDKRVDAVAAENPGLDPNDMVGDRIASACSVPKMLVFAQSLLAVRGMALIAGIQMAELDAASLISGLETPTLIGSKGEEGGRALRTFEKIGSGAAEWSDLDANGYAEIATFFRRSL